MLRVFEILFFTCTCIGRISKYPVPYDYLLTLNHVSGSNSTTSTFFDQNCINWLQSACSDGTCFLAVYRNSTNSEEMFQILDRRENPCLYTTTGDCLLFTKEEYSYSFIYEQENKPETQQCSPQNQNTVYEIPRKCPDGWHSFVRENGKIWCYQVFRGEVKFNAAQIECKKYDAELNGYESDREYTQFKNQADPFLNASEAYLDYKRAEVKHVWLGASRMAPGICGSNPPNKTRVKCHDFPLYWSSKIVSRTTEIRRKYNELDGSGDCFSYSGQFERVDDYGCDQSVPFYSCGKYATW